MKFAMHTYVLTENGPQFLHKFFTTLCFFFLVKKLTTKAYHTQKNGQVEGCNHSGKTAPLCIRAPEDWDFYVQPLTYV